MAIIISKNLAVVPSSFSMNDSHMDVSPQYSYLDFETTGYHRFKPVDYLTLCRWDIYDMHFKRLEMLLQVTGTAVVLWRRKWGSTRPGNERCPDVDKYRGRAHHRCKICFGTGFVGGYDKYVNPRHPEGKIWIRFGPTADDLDSTQPGLRQNFIPGCMVEGTLVEAENCAKKVEDIQIGDKIKVYTLEGEETYSEVIATQKLQPVENKIVTVITERGHKIQCTLDHPFPILGNDKVLAKELKIGDIMKIDPLASKYTDQDREDYTIVDKAQFEEWLKNNIYTNLKYSQRHLDNTLSILEQKELLPVTRYKNAKILSRIVGYCFGDASISKDTLIFSGSEEELRSVQQDLFSLNIQTTFNERDCLSTYQNKKGKSLSIKGCSKRLYCFDTTFIYLLRYLGAPMGDKVIQDLKIPEWIMQNTDLLREFLAVYYDNDGCDMYYKRKGSKYKMQPLRLTFAKASYELADKWGQELINAFNKFGIRLRLRKDTTSGSIRKKDNVTSVVYHIVSDERMNTTWIKFLELIGTRYHPNRRQLYVQGIEYERAKEIARQRLFSLRKQAIELINAGHTKTWVSKQVGVDLRIVIKWYRGQKTKIDDGSFSTFEQWIKDHNPNLDKIKIIEISEYDKFVYDITVRDTHIVSWNNIIGYQCWTVPVPALRDRDLIIAYNEANEEVDRYEVLNVTRNKFFFNRLAQQTFSMQRLDKSDPLVRDFHPEKMPIDLKDYGKGDLAGDDVSYQDLEATLGDGFNDEGYSDGYNQGYQKGYDDCKAGRPFYDVFDTSGFSQDYVTIYGNKFIDGYIEGYKDGYRAAENENQ